MKSAPRCLLQSLFQYESPWSLSFHIRVRDESRPGKGTVTVVSPSLVCGKLSLGSVQCRKTYQKEKKADGPETGSAHAGRGSDNHYADSRVLHSRVQDTDGEQIHQVCWALVVEHPSSWTAAGDCLTHSRCLWYVWWASFNDSGDLTSDRAL